MVEPIAGTAVMISMISDCVNQLPTRGLIVFYTCDETDLDTKFSFPLKLRSRSKNLW
jgi:hypothetical protein